MRKAHPPKFSQIYDEYCKADPNKQLRVGQWFYNQFLAGMTNTSELDQLYNTTDFDTIFAILERYYARYQWEL